MYLMEKLQSLGLKMMRKRSKMNKIIKKKKRIKLLKKF